MKDFPHATPEAGVEAAEEVYAQIRAELDKAGITSEHLITKLKDELEANITRCFNSQGTILYSEPLVDWRTRQEARKDAHRLRGDYPAEKLDIRGGNITIVSNIDREVKPGEFKDANAEPSPVDS